MCSAELSMKKVLQSWAQTGQSLCWFPMYKILMEFSLTVKAATLIFISGRGSAISSAKEGKSGFIYNLIKS